MTDPFDPQHVAALATDRTFLGFVQVTAESGDMNTVKHFLLEDESGAVTVDWVVLTAAIVGLALATVATIGNAINVVGNRINDGLESIQLP